MCCLTTVCVCVLVKPFFPLCLCTSVFVCKRFFLGEKVCFWKLGPGISFQMLPLQPSSILSK